MNAAQVELPIRSPAPDAPWVGLVVTSDGQSFEVVEVSDMFVRLKFAEPGKPRASHGVVTRRTWRVLAGLLEPEATA